jgi:hypothetical protein
MNFPFLKHAAPSLSALLFWRNNDRFINHLRRPSANQRLFLLVTASPLSLLNSTICLQSNRPSSLLPTLTKPSCSSPSLSSLLTLVGTLPLSHSLPTLFFVLGHASLSPFAFVEPEVIFLSAVHEAE